MCQQRLARSLKVTPSIQATKVQSALGRQNSALVTQVVARAEAELAPSIGL